MEKLLVLSGSQTARVASEKIIRLIEEDEASSLPLSIGPRDDAAILSSFLFLVRTQLIIFSQIRADY